MALSNLAQRGVGDFRSDRNLRPLAFPGLQHLKDGGINWCAHGRHYPHPDIKVNPHPDISRRDNFAMKTFGEILAGNIRDRMTASQSVKTQAALAKKAGISQSHVSRLVNQGASATIGRLAKAAKALGCEPYELLLDDEQARRALIERLMRGPSVPTDRVEQAGFVPVSAPFRTGRKKYPYRD